jgi:hypothetical protein
MTRESRQTTTDKCVSVDDTIDHNFTNRKANTLHDSLPEATSPCRLERFGFRTVYALLSRILGFGLLSLKLSPSLLPPILGRLS